MTGIGVGRVPVALPGEELARLQLTREGLGPLVGGGGVSSRPDDEDRCGTLGMECFGGLGTGVAPGLSGQVRDDRHLPEVWSHLFHLLVSCRPGGHIALDLVVQTVDGKTRESAVRAR